MKEKKLLSKKNREREREQQSNKRKRVICENMFHYSSYITIPKIQKS